MSCTRVSLLTNVTRVPTATVSVRGDTPLDVIVIVVPPLGVGVGVGVGDGVGAGVGVGVGAGAGLGEGDVGELPLPPHAGMVNAITITSHRATEPQRFLWLRCALCLRVSVACVSEDVPTS